MSADAPHRGPSKGDDFSKHSKSDVFPIVTANGYVLATSSSSALFGGRRSSVLPMK
jgi:hypothetical protein